jgi:hypothetical protein
MTQRDRDDTDMTQRRHRDDETQSMHVGQVELVPITEHVCSG